MAKLGDYISPAKNIKCGDGNYPVLSMTMHDGIVLQSERFKKSLASSDQSGYKVVAYGQLVVGFPIDEGVLYLQRTIAQGIMSPAYNVWDVDYSCVDPSYFELSLHSPQAMQYYKENLRGSTARRRSLPKEVLLELPLKMPAIDEQKRIAATIENLTHLIDTRRKQIDKIDELVKSRFIEMFENEIYANQTVDSLCSNIVDCPHTTPKYEGELKNPAIRTSEIKKGYLSWATMKYVSDEEYAERIVRLRPMAGDIVYAREGTFGNAAILPKGYNFCLGQRVMLLRPDYTQCNSEYMLYALISERVYRQALEKNNASTVAHVNVKDVKQFVVPLPPLDLQNQFADFVAQVDKSKLAVQKSLEQLEILKKSLMQAYFG